MERPQWEPHFKDFSDPSIILRSLLNEMREFMEQVDFYGPRIEEIHQVEYFEMNTAFCTVVGGASLSVLLVKSVCRQACETRDERVFRTRSSALAETSGHSN